MSENRFNPGDIVQHFKREMLSDEERAGNKYLYEIVGVATHSEDREPMMVYRPLYDDGGMFVRPLEMFLSEVDHDKYPDVKQQFRFEKVSEGGAQECAGASPAGVTPAVQSPTVQSPAVTLEPLDIELSVCKVEDYSQIDISQPFCFTGATDEELSLVCPTDMVPGNTMIRDDGWRAFRIVGVLDFSLIGILAGISEVLAVNGIGLFAVSTYNTDYILTKSENYAKALEVLRSAGYLIKEDR